MDENNSKREHLQAPVLSPETLNPKPVGTSTPSDAELKSEQVSKNNHLGTKILIGSIATVLLAGSVTLAVLAKTGAFSKKSEESTSAETTTEAEESETTGSTTESKAAKVSITALNQITDQQIEYMDELAREYYENYVLTDDVVLDEMTYIGMLRQIAPYIINSDIERDIVQMVYQIQVTDNTGDEPVIRQFYWMHGFTSVYQGGGLDPNSEAMMYKLCYDNWATEGSQKLKGLLHHAENSYGVMEDGIDYSLVKPIESDDGGRLSLIKSLDQITPAMERELKNGGDDWLYYCGIHAGTAVGGVVVDNVEYAGLGFALTTNKTMNRVFVIYKLDITDQNQAEPESQSIYWYISFGDIYEGGEIQTSLTEDVAHDLWSFESWLEGTSTLEELRTCIQYKEVMGWSYEDNLGEEVGE